MPSVPNTTLSGCLYLQTSIPGWRILRACLGASSRVCDATRMVGVCLASALGLFCIHVLRLLTILCVCIRDLAKR